MASQDIHIRVEGRAGRITLDRPAALNALTYDMAMAIEKALVDWRDDPAVSIVIVDAQGERAFCAGGDIQELYEHGKAGDLAYARKFWRDEYRLNALIAGYGKPYFAFLQGFVMGGGVGIGCHGSHRIVCETSRVAMPECGIGLIPDVGGTWLLARAPGRMGEYLGLTGARMDAADAMHAGFADHFVAYANWEDLKAMLCETGDAGVIERFAASPGLSPMAGNGEKIDRLFANATALECLAALEADGSPFALKAAGQIRAGCPISVACTHALIAMARRAANVREALDNELRFTWRSMSDGEFLEGVRAQLIDKDRKPVWKTARLEDVTPAKVAAMLAPIPDAAN